MIVSSLPSEGAFLQESISSRNSENKSEERFGPVTSLQLDKPPAGGASVLEPRIYTFVPVGYCTQCLGGLVGQYNSEACCILYERCCSIFSRNRIVEITPPQAQTQEVTTARTPSTVSTVRSVPKRPCTIAPRKRRSSRKLPSPSTVKSKLKFSFGTITSMTPPLARAEPEYQQEIPSGQAFSSITECPPTINHRSSSAYSWRATTVNFNPLRFVINTRMPKPVSNPSVKLVKDPGISWLPKGSAVVPSFNENDNIRATVSINIENPNFPVYVKEPSSTESQPHSEEKLLDLILQILSRTNSSYELPVTTTEIQNVYNNIIENNNVKELNNGLSKQNKKPRSRTSSSASPNTYYYTKLNQKRTTLLTQETSTSVSSQTTTATTQPSLVTTFSTNVLTPERSTVITGPTTTTQPAHVTRLTTTVLTPKTVFTSSGSTTIPTKPTSSGESTAKTTEIVVKTPTSTVLTTHVETSSSPSSKAKCGGRKVVSESGQINETVQELKRFNETLVLGATDNDVTHETPMKTDKNQHEGHLNDHSESISFDRPLTYTEVNVTSNSIVIEAQDTPKVATEKAEVSSINDPASTIDPIVLNILYPGSLVINPTDEPVDVKKICRELLSLSTRNCYGEGNGATITDLGVTCGRLRATADAYCSIANGVG